MTNRFPCRVLLAMLLLASLGAAAALEAQSSEADKFRNAVIVLDEIMGAADQAIPTGVLEKAEAIAVFPGTVKGGFVFAAQRGRGIMSVRHAGGWSMPAFLTLTGGSVGAQIGGESIDVILVVMNRRGLDNLLANQFKIGADGSVAAGPVGRSAEAATDIQMRAQILSYSRSRGLFAGVSLNGAAIREDQDANKEFYGAPLTTRAIVLDGQAKKPASADAVAEWHKALVRYAKGK